MPRSFESLFMHFDPFLSVLEQKKLRFTTKDLLSYPLDFHIAHLSREELDTNLLNQSQY